MRGCRVGYARDAMTDPGPAQLDLIRRYARTLREMHAGAMAARGPRIGARAARRVVDAAEAAGQVAPASSPRDAAAGEAPTPAR
jgi:hypothetical protein